MYVAEFLGSSRPRYAGKSEIDWWTRPVSAGRLRDADVDADAEVACQVDSAELWLNSTNELRRWSVRKRAPVRERGEEGERGETEWVYVVREREREAEKGWKKKKKEVLALGLCSLSAGHSVNDDELIMYGRARETNLRPLHLISKTSAPAKSGSTASLSCGDIRLSNVGLVSNEKKKGEPIIYFLPLPRMRDAVVTAAEALFHFVSSYDGFREINRKVGWTFRSSGIDLALRLHTGLSYRWGIKVMLHPNVIEARTFCWKINFLYRAENISIIYNARFSIYKRNSVFEYSHLNYIYGRKFLI